MPDKQKKKNNKQSFDNKTLRTVTIATWLHDPTNEGVDAITGEWINAY